jgi:glutaredoxin
MCRALSMGIVEETQAKINSNKVMVFSKSYCPFCVRAKNALKDLGVDYEVMELDKVKGGSDTQAALLEMTGQRTVPNVFVNGNHLGGCDDTLAAISSGALKKML